MDCVVMQCIFKCMQALYFLKFQGGSWGGCQAYKVQDCKTTDPSLTAEYLVGGFGLVKKMLW